jgi:flagellar protein FliJ
VKNFVFKLESLLKYRRHRRDLCRQLLADVFADDRRLLENRAALEQQRAGQIGEIRALHAPGRIDIDRTAARRYFAGHVQTDMLFIDRDRAIVGEQLSRCQQALMQADREVKVLEKLRDKQHADFRYGQNRDEGRELDEMWMATHLTEESRR